MDYMFSSSLRDDYPTLFRDDVGSILRPFHFECGNGLFGILDGTLNQVYKHATKNKIDITLSQVKEKFGSLRIYYRGGDSRISVLFGIAELVSENICELCGAAGTLSTRQGWMRVRCVIHENLTADMPIPTYQKVKNFSPAYIEAVDAVLGLLPLDSTMKWLQEPRHELDDNKPYEMMNTIEGCEQLLKFIRQINYGVYV